MKNSFRRGFTLIELLVVIGILTILLAITLIAINPSRQFSQANNATRRSAVNAILNALGQYQSDNKGLLPSGISSTAATVISTGGTDICGALVSTYTAQLPVDPQYGTYTDCTSYDTQYTVIRSSSNNRVTVCAPRAELGDTICVTR